MSGVANVRTGPVCVTCKDTHKMLLGERVVPCTQCPLPCDLCRWRGLGAFCATTPCDCVCHASPELRAARANANRIHQEVLDAVRLQSGGGGGAGGAGPQVLSETDRLRGLIRDAEERGCKCGPAAELCGCPWCASTTAYDEALNPILVHADDCPAFSAKGVVH